jgi:hypothetical protein
LPSSWPLPWWLLVTSVMKDRGYPTEGHDQIMADLSVEHAGTLDHFRAAHQISMQAEADTVGTEDLRLAMLHYRALFSDLLGQPTESGPTAAVTEPPAETADAEAAAHTRGATDAGTTDARPEVPAPPARPAS